MTRALRIKEHLNNRNVKPNERQLAASNSTLQNIDVNISVDENFFLISKENISNKGHSKIVLLGDSIAEASFAGEGSRITDYLNIFSRNEKKLYEYLNAGCSGMTTLHFMVSFIGKIMPLNPSHLLLMPGSIDIGACGLEQNFWTKTVGTTPFIDPPDKNPVQRGRRNYAYRDALMAGINKMCDCLDISFHLLTPPITPIASWHKKIEGIEGLVKLRNEINQETRKTAKKNNIKLLDIDFILEKNPDHFYDIEHLNAKGCEAVAQIIHSHIYRKGDFKSEVQTPLM